MNDLASTPTLASPAARVSKQLGYSPERFKKERSRSQVKVLLGHALNRNGVFCLFQQKEQFPGVESVIM